MANHQNVSAGLHLFDQIALIRVGVQYEKRHQPQEADSEDFEPTHY
jgi:hypothetical protein